MQDDDLLLQYFRQHVKLEENVIIDHHDSEIFGCDFFDLVIQVSCETSELYHRYQARQYSKQKTEENMEAELLMVVYEQI